LGKHVLPGIHVRPLVQSDWTVTVHSPLSQHGPGQILGEHEPKRSHAPPADVHADNAVIEQFPFTQHEPLHGFGAHEVPPRNVPPAVAHCDAVRSEHVVPLQQVPGGVPHGLPEQLVPGPRQSPPTSSQAEKVRSVHEVPTQHAPV
jgi:hypothetical protein